MARSGLCTTADAGHTPSPHTSSNLTHVIKGPGCSRALLRAPTSIAACLHAHFHGVQWVDGPLAGCTRHGPCHHVMRRLVCSRRCWSTAAGCWGRGRG